jgi:hypothetical protein
MDVPAHFVLFADLLGFKRLVLDHRVPYWHNLDFRARGSRQLVASIMSAGNPLAAAFRAFHGAIEGLLDDIVFEQSAQVRVFSDSVFFSGENHLECFHFAEQLMRRCVSARAPVRMGIGYGSFVTYGLAMEETPTLKYLSSQFFGSGVVYAVEAEKCLKGMRIALHQGVVEAVQFEPYRTEKILELSPDERREGVGHEWSYVGRWSGQPNIRGQRELEPVVANRLLADINAMHGSAPPEVQNQYERTAAALTRMKAHVEAGPRANEV